jgi:hypothetical protein
MGSNESKVKSGKTPFFYVLSVQGDVIIHSHGTSFGTGDEFAMPADGHLESTL